MIDLVDEWVRSVVAEGAGKGVDVSVGTLDEVKKGLRVSLLGIAENTEARGYGFDTGSRPGSEGEAARRERPVTVVLDYAVVADTKDAAASGNLGRVLATLLLAQNGAPPPLSKEMLEAGWQAARMSVGQPEHPLVRDPAAFWSALDVPLRPSIGLRVDAVLNPYKPVFVRLVQEAVVGTTPLHGDRDVEVRTARASAAGQVVDGRTLEPLPGAVVTPSEGTGATTNERGIFVLRGIPQGKATLQVAHPRYGDAQVEVEVPAPGEPVPAVRVAMPPRDPAGARTRPVRSLQAPDGTPEPYRVVRSGPYATVTDAEGRYTLPPSEEEPA